MQAHCIVRCCNAYASPSKCLYAGSLLCKGLDSLLQHVQSGHQQVTVALEDDTFNTCSTEHSAKQISTFEKDDHIHCRSIRHMLTICQMQLSLENKKAQHSILPKYGDAHAALFPSVVGMCALHASDYLPQETRHWQYK